MVWSCTFLIKSSKQLFTIMHLDIADCRGKFLLVQKKKYIEKFMAVLVVLFLFFLFNTFLSL